MAAITNPPHAGDLCDISTPTQCQLLVDGSPLDLSSTSKWNLHQLQVSYDGKRVTFSEVADPSIANPTYDPEDDVELKLNLDGSLKTYFKGRIKERDHTGQTRQEAILYTAWCYQSLSNEVTALAWNEIPWYQRFAGVVNFTVVTTTSSDGTPSNVQYYGSFISVCLTDIFTFNQDALIGIGISATVGSPGLDTFPEVKANRDFTIQNLGFYDAVKQICDYYPQKKAYFDHLQDAWTFPDVLNAPEITVDIASANLLEHVYKMDNSNRFTAVKLVSAVDGRMIIPSRGIALCEKGWNEAYEDDWSLFKVGLEAADGVPDDGGYSYVYRRWVIPVDTEAEVNPNAPYRAVAALTYGGQTRYQTLAAYIDLHTGTIITRDPVIKAGNAWDNAASGYGAKPVGPDAVYFKWIKVDALVGGGWISQRVPAGGYEGTAFDLFGLQREKVVMVDQTEITTANALARLNLLKDVKISASVPIEGDPIPELINLNKRIYWRSSSPAPQTNIQSIPTLLLGYTYDFGKRGKSTVDVTTDVSGLIKIN